MGPTADRPAFIIPGRNSSTTDIQGRIEYWDGKWDAESKPDAHAVAATTWLAYWL
jgi:hypothetical protein